MNTGEGGIIRYYLLYILTNLRPRKILQLLSFILINLVPTDRHNTYSNFNAEKVFEFFIIFQEIHMVL